MARITIGTNYLSYKDLSFKMLFDFVTFLQWQLMVAKLKVQGVENFGLLKGIKNLLWYVHGVCQNTFRCKQIFFYILVTLFSI